jgi:hypothetical protein
MTLLTNPELPDIFNMFQRNLLLNFNCHHIGTIQSFNPANQTATASINYKKEILIFDTDTQKNKTQLVDYPPIADSPVMFLRGGQTSLTFPIAKNDECFIFFNDRDMDAWFAGSVIGAPDTSRLHSFSDAVILVGPRSKGNVLTNFDMNHLLLQWIGGGQVGVSSSKVLIGNDTYKLNALLQELISEIQSITVPITSAPGVSGTPLNSASLGATAGKLGELLE